MIVKEEAIPLVEERAVVTKRMVETGRVDVRTRVEQRNELVETSVAHDEVDVERVPVGREVQEIPQVRQEGDVTIVPVLEERVVVEKRLFLVEEIHLRRTRRSEQIAQPVTLASQRAEIVRHQTSGEERA